MVEYKCVKCKTEWYQEDPGIDECPICGSFYVEWLNYAKWKLGASPTYRRIIDGKTM